MDLLQGQLVSHHISQIMSASRYSPSESEKYKQVHLATRLTGLSLNDLHTVLAYVKSVTKPKVSQEEIDAIDELEDPMLAIAAKIPDLEETEAEKVHNRINALAEAKASAHEFTYSTTAADLEDFLNLRGDLAELKALVDEKVSTSALAKRSIAILESVIKKFVDAVIPTQTATEELDSTKRFDENYNLVESRTLTDKLMYASIPPGERHEYALHNHVFTHLLVNKPLGVSVLEDIYDNRFSDLKSGKKYFDNFLVPCLLTAMRDAYSEFSVEATLSTMYNNAGFLVIDAAVNNVAFAISSDYVRNLKTLLLFLRNKQLLNIDGTISNVDDVRINGTIPLNDVTVAKTISEFTDKAHLTESVNFVTMSRKCATKARVLATLENLHNDYPASKCAVAINAIISAILIMLAVIFSNF